MAAKDFQQPHAAPVRTFHMAANGSRVIPTAGYIDPRLLSADTEVDELEDDTPLPSSSSTKSSTASTLVPASPPIKKAKKTAKTSSSSAEPKEAEPAKPRKSKKAEQSLADPTPSRNGTSNGGQQQPLPKPLTDKQRIDLRVAQDYGVLIKFTSDALAEKMKELEKILGEVKVLKKEVLYECAEAAALQAALDRLVELEREAMEVAAKVEGVKAEIAKLLAMRKGAEETKARLRDDQEDRVRRAMAPSGSKRKDEQPHDSRPGPGWVTRSGGAGGD